MEGNVDVPHTYCVSTQLLAVSYQQQDSVFKLTTDFKDKGANFGSKTIKYCFYPKLKAQ